MVCVSSEEVEGCAVAAGESSAKARRRLDKRREARWEVVGSAAVEEVASDNEDEEEREATATLPTLEDAVACGGRARGGNSAASNRTASLLSRSTKEHMITHTRTKRYE